MKIKNRHILSKKNISNIIEKISTNYRFDIDLKNRVFESGIFDNKNLIFIDDIPCFVLDDDNVYFTIFGINLFKPKNKFIVVDMGAVKFVINGADIMTPGIVNADIDIKIDDQVWICDEKNKKVLATGIALINGEDMNITKKGKAIKSQFFVGDLLWNSFAKSL